MLLAYLDAVCVWLMEAGLLSPTAQVAQLTESCWCPELPFHSMRQLNRTDRGPRFLGTVGQFLRTLASQDLWRPMTLIVTGISCQGSLPLSCVISPFPGCGEGGVPYHQPFPPDYTHTPFSKTNNLSNCQGSFWIGNAGLLHPSVSVRLLWKNRTSRVNKY